MKLLRSRADRSRRGSAFAGALLVVITVAALGAAMLQLSTSLTRRQIVDVDQKRALYLAEAGLSEGFYALSLGGSGNVGTKELPAALGDGLFWVEATDLGDDRVELTSTGLAGAGRFALTLSVERTSEAPQARGVFADKSLSVGKGCLIDAFDSSAAELPPGTQLGASLGSNADIEIDGTPGNPTRILGDVTPGPQGSVRSGLGVLITGSTAPAATASTSPPVEVPELPARGPLILNARERATLGNGEGNYEVVQLSKDARLTLVGPTTLSFGSLLLDQKSELVIDATSGAIRVYITGDLALDAKSAISSVGQDPRNVSLILAGTGGLGGYGASDKPLELAAGGKFYGSIYAPTRALQIAEPFELFGGIVAERLELLDGVKLHFDRALMSVTEGWMGAPQKLAWQIVDLPEPKLASLRYDPVEALDLADVDLPKPADARQDAVFKIAYIAKDGKLKLWSGAESKFDWRKVQSVVQIRRAGDSDFRDDDGDGKADNPYKSSKKKGG